MLTYRVDSEEVRSLLREACKRVSLGPLCNNEYNAESLKPGGKGLPAPLTARERTWMWTIGPISVGMAAGSGSAESSSLQTK